MQRTQRIFDDLEADERRSQSRENSKSPAHSDHGNQENKPKEAEKKKKRQIKPRFKFEPKHLKNSDKGLRLFYNSASKLKTEQNNGENRNDIELLNQFLRLYKEWHFNLVPKFELNYFISKCHNFGRENTIRNYMGRMRSVHTGANTWDAFEEEEDDEPVVPPTQNITQTQNLNQTQNQNQNQNRWMPTLNNQGHWTTQTQNQPQTQTQNNVIPTQQINTQAVGANNNNNAQRVGNNNNNRGQFSDWKRNNKPPPTNKFLENQMRRKAQLDHQNIQNSAPRSHHNPEVRRPTQTQEDDDFIDYNQMLEQEELEQGAVEDPIMLDDELFDHNYDDDPDNAAALDEADLEYRIKKLKT